MTQSIKSADMFKLSGYMFVEVQSCLAIALKQEHKLAAACKFTCVCCCCCCWLQHLLLWRCAVGAGARGQAMGRAVAHPGAVPGGRAARDAAVAAASLQVRRGLQPVRQLSMTSSC